MTRTPIPGEKFTCVKSFKKHASQDWECGLPREAMSSIPNTARTKPKCTRQLLGLLFYFNFF
jgi:hypothetical protein